MAIDIRALSDPQPLFSSQDSFALTDAYMREAMHAVQTIPADAFLNTPTEDIISSLVERHSFTPPILKRDEAYIDGPHEVELRRRDFGEEVRLRGTLVALVVPIEGDATLLHVNPNRFGQSIRANLHYNNVIFTVRDVNLQAQQVNAELEKQFAEVEQMLGFQRIIADQHRNALPQRLRPLIEERKSKLLADRNMVAGLSFPLRARHDAPKTYVAPVARKKIVVARPTTSAPFVPEPVLDEAVYTDILRIIDGMAHVMERSPSAFATMDEESLRQHLVPSLSWLEMRVA